MKYLTLFDNSSQYKDNELDLPRYNISYLNSEDEVVHKKTLGLVLEVNITSSSTAMDRSYILPMYGLDYKSITDSINSTEPSTLSLSSREFEYEESSIDTEEEERIRKEYEKENDELIASIPMTLDNDNYDFIVNWGDGTFDTFQSLNDTSCYHTYESIGTYQIEIRGTFKRIYRNTSTSAVGGAYPTPRKLTRVLSWGNSGLVSMNNAFNGESNLYSIPLTPKGSPTFSEVTDFSYAFCSTGLTEIPYSYISDRGIFDECTKVVTFFECFYNCTKMTGVVPPGLFKNCTLVTSFGYVFGLCSSLSGELPLGIFSYAENINNVYYAFYNCKNITGDLPEDMFVNNTKITNFECCFRNCTGLNGNIPSGLFRNCSKANMFRSVFRGCTNIVSVDYNLFENCSSNNINLRSAFEDSGIVEVPEGLLDGLTGTGIMYERMFYKCTKLTRIPGNIFSNITNSNQLTGAEGMFAYCSSLSELSLGDSIVEPTDNGLSQWSDPILIKKWMGLFGECNSFDQLPNIQEELGGSKVRLTESIPGDIILSDKTVVKSSEYSHDSSNPAIAIVVDYDSTRNEGEKIYAMALNDLTKLWTPQALVEDIPDLTNRTTAVTDTWKGKESTNIIKNYSGYTEEKYPAVAYCVNYSTQGTNPGDWYLGDWSDGWYAFMRKSLFEKSINKINSEYPEAKAINFRDGTTYWTSNEYSEINAGCVNSNSTGVTGGVKWYGYYVRPCLSI